MTAAASTGVVDEQSEVELVRDDDRPTTFIREAARDSILCESLQQRSSSAFTSSVEMLNLLYVLLGVETETTTEGEAIASDVDDGGDCSSAPTPGSRRPCGGGGVAGADGGVCSAAGAVGESSSLRESSLLVAA